MAVPRKAPPRAVKAAAPIYQLRIELLDVEPTIWRRILVPGSIKLHKLHVVLLWTMGWSGGHLHEFVIGHDHYGEPDPDFDTPPQVQREDRVTLAAALGSRKSFIYLYDFGDGWEHQVTVEKILPADPRLKLPQCLDGANACPPEDVGGPPGYADTPTSWRRYGIPHTKNTTPCSNGAAGPSIPLPSGSTTSTRPCSSPSSDWQDGLGLTLTIGQQALEIDFLAGALGRIGDASAKR